MMQLIIHRLTLLEFSLLVFENLILQEDVT